MPLRECWGRSGNTQVTGYSGSAKPNALIQINRPTGFYRLPGRSSSPHDLPFRQLRQVILDFTIRPLRVSRLTQLGGLSMALGSVIHGASSLSIDLWDHERLKAVLLRLTLSTPVAGLGLPGPLETSWTQQKHGTLAEIDPLGAKVG
jgi:hypothetical protein